MNSKKPQPVKNTENVDVNGLGPKDGSATVMSYSRLSLESEAAQNGQLLGNITGIRSNHPNGLVTFSSNGFGQPIYANTRQVPVMPIKPIMNRNNNSNFGSSSHLQQIIGENTTPRFMKNSSTLEV